MRSEQEITLSQDTIHNPDEPRHYMRIKPVNRRIRVLFAGNIIAESTQALRLLEAGRDIYDPVLYLPPADIQAKLVQKPRRTFCPLKGHASYFDLVVEQDPMAAVDIAWSYQDTLEFAALIKDRIAFDAARVVIEEHPLTAMA